MNKNGWGAPINGKPGTNYSEREKTSTLKQKWRERYSIRRCTSIKHGKGRKARERWKVYCELLMFGWWTSGDSPLCPEVRIVLGPLEANGVKDLLSMFHVAPSCLFWLLARIGFPFWWVALFVNARAVNINVESQSRSSPLLSSLFARSSSVAPERQAELTVTRMTSRSFHLISSSYSQIQRLLHLRHEMGISWLV